MQINEIDIARGLDTLTVIMCMPCTVVCHVKGHKFDMTQYIEQAERLSQQEHTYQWYGRVGSLWSTVLSRVPSNKAMRLKTELATY